MSFYVTADTRIALLFQAPGTLNCRILIPEVCLIKCAETSEKLLIEFWAFCLFFFFFNFKREKEHSRESGGVRMGSPRERERES